jgi:hypothetical protein
MFVYSVVPLIGLALLSQKYAQRQARLERQYQGHMAAAEKKLEKLEGGDPETKTEPAAVDKPAEGRTYSTPEDTKIPLAPLTLIFLALAGFAAIMLARELRKRDTVLSAPTTDN